MAVELLEEQIAKQAAYVLGIARTSINPHTPLVEYGLDSLRAMEIIANIEDEFDIEASDIDIAMLHSLADLVAYVDRKVTEG